jgi:hypothetical protein
MDIYIYADRHAGPVVAIAIAIARLPLIRDDHCEDGDDDDDDDREIDDDIENSILELAHDGRRR